MKYLKAYYIINRTAKVLFVLLLMISCAEKAFCQLKKDSLLKVLRTTVSDTNKVKTLNKLCELSFLNGDFDSAFIYAHKAEKIAVKANYKKGLSNTFFNVGVIYYLKHDYPKALDNYNKALEIRKAIGDKKLTAFTYNNMGVIYAVQGNFSEAIKCYSLSIKIKEEIGDKKGVAFTYGNIGIINDGLGNYPEALKNHFACLNAEKEANNKKGMADSYTNIGNIYNNLKEYSSALTYYTMSLKLSEEISYKAGIAAAYNNIGLIYYEKMDFSKALSNYETAVKLNEEMDDKSGLAVNYNNIANLHFQQKNYKKAFENFNIAVKIYYQIDDKYGTSLTINNLGKLLLMEGKYAEGKEWILKGLKMAQAIGAKDILKQCYQNLASADKGLGNKKAAFENYKIYIAYRDSLLNEENTRKVVQQQMQFDFDNKEAIIKAEQDKKDLVTSKEKYRQKVTIYAVSSGLAVVLFLMGFIIRGYRQKQKINLLLSTQKHLIEEKQKEILDSIHYARRIQVSLLPTEKYFIKKLYELKKKH